MKTTCPHCSVHIDIDPETHAALQGQTHFQCPGCNSLVPVPPMSVSSPQPPSPAPASILARAHHGLNRNLLILGSAALLVLGGLGFFLASRSGNIFNSEQKIANQIIHNSYFTQLIASGATTEKNLEAVTDIRSYEGGFIGISKEALSWDQAQALARRAGTTILAVGNHPGNSGKPLLDWLSTSYPTHLTSPIWVREGDAARVLDGLDVLAVTTLDRQRKVFLQWGVGMAAPGATKNQSAVALLASKPSLASTDALAGNLDYGLLISYGMQTFTGPAGGALQSEKPATCFAPANVDVKSWAKLAKEGGMTFAVMSVKHSTGFRLWDAPFDDYDVGGSPFKRDLLAEFVESCNAEGLMPGANYIVTDVHREGTYRRYEPVPATHMKLVKQEIADLLTRYPGLRVLVFGHFGRFTTQEAAEIRTLVRTLNPGCVILDDETSGRIYQCKSTVKGWFQASPEAENPKAADLFGDIQKSRDEGKPFLLNVGPAQDGQIPPTQRDLVLKMKGFGSHQNDSAPR